VDKPIDEALKDTLVWGNKVCIGDRKTPDLNLPAFELSFANAANALIIERFPFPESIARAQDPKVDRRG